MNKQMIKSEVNKAYRIREGMVGEALSPKQREELGRLQAEAISKAASGEVEADATPVIPDPGSDKPHKVLKGVDNKADLTTIGTRTRMRMKIVDQVVGKTDFGLVVDRKEMEMPETVVQSLLTVEEATQLGEQNWKPYVDGQYCTIVEGRRMIVASETYKALCKA